VNPSFDSIDLVDSAPGEAFGSPALRANRQHLPDVEGEVFQACPAGGRDIVVRGVLASSAQATADLAAADLKAKVRARQGLSGHVGTYEGIDGESYPASLLAEYRQAGPMRITPVGSAFRGLVEIEARIVTQP